MVINKITFACCLGLLLTLFSFTQVQAQQAQIYRKISLPQIKDILQSEGLSLSDGDEYSVFTKFEGISVRVGTLKSGEALFVIDVVPLDPKREYCDAIEAFNENYGGSAVIYKSEEYKTIVLRARLDLSGGVTLERIQSFLSGVRRTQAAFRIRFY